MVSTSAEPLPISRPAETDGGLSGGRLRTIARLRPLAWLTFAVPLASVAIVLWLAWTQSLLVPNGDEWAMVGTLQQVREQGLRWETLWRPNDGGHRLVWTRLSGLALIELTDWNRRAMLTVNVALVVLSFALLMAAVRNSFRATWPVWVLVVPTSLLMFTLARYHNWLKAFTDKIPTVLGIAVVVWALSRVGQSRLLFGVAVGGALLASLSSLSGLVAWIAFAPAVFLHDRRRGALWAAIGAAVIVAYSIDYPFTDDGQPVAFSASAVGYLLTFLGGPLADGDTVVAAAAAVASLVLVVPCLVVLWRAHRRSPRGEQGSLLAWVGLAAFAFGVALLIGIGRSDSNTGQASRYIALSLLWWIAFLVVALAAAVAAIPEMRGAGPWRWPTRALAAVLLVAAILVTTGTVVTSQHGLEQAIRWHREERRRQDCLVEQDPIKTSCLEVFGKPEKIGPWVAYLKEQRLAIYR